MRRSASAQGTRGVGGGRLRWLAAFCTKVSLVGGMGVWVYVCVGALAARVLLAADRRHPGQSVTLTSGVWIMRMESMIQARSAVRACACGCGPVAV